MKDVRDRHGRKRPITVRTWSTIKDVKDLLQQHLHVPPSAQRLYFGPLLTSAGELPNHRTLHDAGIYRSGETLLLDIKGGAVDSGIGSSEGTSISSLRSTAVSDVCVSSSMLDTAPRPLRRIVQQARRGFALGLKPELVLDGSGGTYFLHDARKVKVAVFKPADEEPYAENNPRGYVAQGRPCEYDFGLDDGMSLRAGICPGEACLREVAAFLLDHGGFSGVPMTTLAEARHPAFNTNGARLKLSQGGAAVGSHSLTLASPGMSVSSTSSHQNQMEKKVGSLQEYVHAECSMDDLSPSKLSVDEVHKIAILDIRLMNADRNSANLLCRRRPEDNTLELVPIDHGYCLRSVCDVAWFDWCWLDWAQVKEPLCKKSRDYVLGLDIEADVRLLQERLHIGTEALDYFRASSKLLQAGVKAGLTLYDIAVMCCRNDNVGEVPSKLEMLVSMASELSTSAVENGRWHHAAASRALEDQLVHPEGETLISGIHKKSPCMLKSASSANFSSFMSADSFSSDVKKSAPPPMTQSSASSDSSSDAGDAVADVEECEVWAAAVIADVSMEQGPVCLSRQSRSFSIGSESSSSTDDSSSLSSSPKGFWYVRPGSSAADKIDDEVTWTPDPSPRHSLELSLPSLRRASTSNLRAAFEGKEENSRPAMVTFDVSPVTHPTPPPLLDDHLNKVDASYVRSAPPGVKSGGIVRSQSYSAFSFKDVLDSPEFSQTNIRAGNSTTAESEQYRTYFLKFVDLLIARETSSASHRREAITSSAKQKDGLFFDEKTNSTLVHA